jgi:hypothetical protein
MNLIQMLCCSLLVKSSELGQQYLVSKTDSIQSTLRARRAQTAVEATRFLDSLVQELTLSGKDVCKCADATPSPEPVEEGRILKDTGATWHRPKN